LSIYHYWFTNKNNGRKCFLLSFSKLRSYNNYIFCVHLTYIIVFVKVSHYMLHFLSSTLHRFDRYDFIIDENEPTFILLVVIFDGGDPMFILVVVIVKTIIKRASFLWQCSVLLTKIILFSLKSYFIVVIVDEKNIKYIYRNSFYSQKYIKSST